MTFIQQIYILLPFIVALIFYAISWLNNGDDTTYYIALLLQLVGIGHIFWITSRPSTE